ncbi:METTL21B [Symbiodinium sp. CCMP2592]|nr:METTL21B [Symbiodinium sp. CCMP2592]
MASRAAFLITEVNIRTGQAREWCNLTLGDGLCLGSMSYEIPYAALYNQEPGIPLSLKAPSFERARFTMEAGTIIVDFDRATLQGALTVDAEFNDGVPETIDYSTQPDGLFDCARVFTDPTILLLGPYPETECIWMTDSRVQVNLPSIINVSVGDSLFVRPDTIYTIPRNGEWSPAAMGGVQVEPPDPLEPPVIVLTGSTNLDQCTPVRLVGVDSFQTGKLPRYSWDLVNGTEEDPNPRDLTNNPNRIIDVSREQLVREALRTATEFNMGTLEMPSDYMEAATTYKMLFSVTSRWGLTTVKEVMLTKLNFPAPMVSINGPAQINRRRPDRITLEAVGIPSACANASNNLGYRWIATSGNLNFADFPDIITSASTLAIPPFVLEPDTTNTMEFNVYNFTVECFVNTVQGNVPERTASATVTVRIYRSDVYVVYRTASRMVTKGDILVLDVRGSQDPDYPTLEGQTFRGTFVWSCFTPPPERGACFGGSATGILEDLITCRQDIGTQMQDGGVTFFAPLFDDLIFCRYTRGVIMFQTQNFSSGEYKFSVQATSYDGRQASEDVYIEMTDVQVPKILLTVANAQAKYPISFPIQISGTEENTNIARRLQISAEPREYSWTVLAYYPNPDYDPDLAEELLNDPNNPYTVDQYKYVDQSDRFDTRDQRLFRTDPSLPNIIIQPNVLQPSTKYKFRLNIHLTNVTGYSDIVIETAGLPPRSGRLEVTPVNATMDTPRVLSAPNWVATDLPLTYNFGYIKFVEGNPLDSMFNTDRQQVSSKELPRLVLGEASTNYTVHLFVEVYTPYGAFSRAEVAVQSLPVENLSQAVIDGLDNAQNADASNLVNDLDYILSLDPDPGTVQQVIDILDENVDNIPTTPTQLERTASTFAEIVAGGQDSDQVLDLVESLVQTSANTGAITLESSLAGTFFGIFGNLMPPPAVERGRLCLHELEGQSQQHYWERTGESMGCSSQECAFSSWAPAQVGWDFLWPRHFQISDDFFLRHRGLFMRLNMDLPGADKVEVAALDWADVDASAVCEETWDLILGSDLVYSRDTASLMPKVVSQLRLSQERRTGTSPTAVYCQSLHRWGFAGYDIPFLEGCAAAGLVPEALWLQGYGPCTGHLERDCAAVEVDRGVRALAQRPAIFRLAERSRSGVEPVAGAWLRYAAQWRQERDTAAAASMEAGIITDLGREASTARIGLDLPRPSTCRT